MARRYASVASSHRLSTSACSPSRNARSAGTDLVLRAPSRLGEGGVPRRQIWGRSAQVTPLVSASIESAGAVTDTRASGAAVSLANRPRSSRTFRPARSTLPRRTLAAPKPRPSATSWARVASGPGGCASTVWGSTVRMPPTPSRFALRVSTRSRPSRASAVSAPLGTSGRTATTDPEGTMLGPVAWSLGQRAPRAAAPAAATAAGTTHRARRADRRGSASVATAAPSTARAAANCSAPGNRSAGTLASARVMACSTFGGTVVRTVRSDGTGSTAWRAMMPWAVGAGEWRLPREHLVQHAGQAVDVAARVHVAAPRRLLGAHVGRRADREAGLGQLLGAGRAQRAGDAEVGDDRLVAVEEDVLGLDVTVDDAAAVRVGQRAGHVAGDSERVLDRKLLLPREARAQRLPSDAWHRVPEDAGLFAGVEDRQDVRVLKPGGEPDLPEEPLGAEGRGELRPKDLHRHLAGVPQVLAPDIPSPCRRARARARRGSDRSERPGAGRKFRSEEIRKGAFTRVPTQWDRRQIRDRLCRVTPPCGSRTRSPSSRPAPGSRPAAPRR